MGKKHLAVFIVAISLLNSLQVYATKPDRHATGVSQSIGRWEKSKAEMGPQELKSQGRALPAEPASRKTQLAAAGIVTIVALAGAAGLLATINGTTGPDVTGPKKAASQSPSDVIVEQRVDASLKHYNSSSGELPAFVHVSSPSLPLSSHVRAPNGSLIPHYAQAPVAPRTGKKGKKAVRARKKVERAILREEMQLIDLHASKMEGIRKAIVGFGEELGEFFKRGPFFTMLKEQTPRYLDDLKAIQMSYRNLKLLGEGSSSAVLSASLARSRPHVGLKTGDKIALRLSYAGSVERGLRFSQPQSIEVHARLHSLKEMTEYNPDFYGAFLAPLFSSDIVLAYRQNPSGYERIYTFVETEYVDQTLESYLETGKPIPDSYVFETILGEWVNAKYGHIQIVDRMTRNVGMKLVDHYRVYHIGEFSYLLPPGLTPKRLDLDTWIDLRGNPAAQADWACRGGDLFYDRSLESHAGRQAAREANTGACNVPSIVQQNFHRFLVTEENPIPTSPNVRVRHYTIPSAAE